jgi:hypothetical protein
LTDSARQAFEVWVRQRSDELIKDADKYIAHLERMEDKNAKVAPAAGVGVYFFKQRQ